MTEHERTRPHVGDRDPSTPVDRELTALDTAATGADDEAGRSVRVVDDPTDAVLLVALVDLSADVGAGRRYEDEVLALLGRHGGRLERRLRTGDGETEVHVIRFASRAGYDSFLVDPERAALRAALGGGAPTTRVLEVRDV